MPRTKKTKSLCVECYNDFYNGKNSLGVVECWSFKSARVTKKKFIPMDLRPPWDTVPVEVTLSCHRRQRYVAVGPKVMR